MENQLELRFPSPIIANNAGLQISRGNGRHMDRVLDHFDLLFVRQGMLPIQEDQQAFEVVAGQTLLLWPNRHHWGTAEFSPDMRMYWLHFKLADFSPRPKTNSPAEIDHLFGCPQYTTVARPDVLESLFRRFLDDQATGRLMPPYSSLLVSLILCEIADQRAEGRVDRTAASLAGRALAYIRSHLNLPLTASSVAEQLGYNPEYLNRIFHQIYQHTLTQEIHLSRIGYARYLLLHSTLSIKEISLNCGFTDINYFSRLFKRYEGTTPMNFRRLHAQAEINYE